METNIEEPFENHFASSDRDNQDNSLALKFTLGYTSSMISGVHNLTTGDKKV
jgi:hypothetical protein